MDAICKHPDGSQKDLGLRMLYKERYKISIITEDDAQWNKPMTHHFR